MPIPRVMAAAEAKELKDLAVAVRYEAKGIDREILDVALVADVVGLAKRLQAESADLEVLRSRMVRLARQTPR